MALKHFHVYEPYNYTRVLSDHGDGACQQGLMKVSSVPKVTCVKVSVFGLKRYHY